MTMVFWIMALLVTAIAAFTDALTGRIPNSLTLTTAVVALGTEAVMGVAVLALGLLGGLTCSAVPLLLYRCSKNAIGGGDIKLFVVLGVLLGPASGLETQLIAYVTCSIFAVTKLAWEKRLSCLLRNAIALVVARFAKPKGARTPPPEALLTPIRIGPAIFVSCALEACWSWNLL
jgi:Flp pilus assembly protein protease CpaA